MRNFKVMFLLSLHFKIHPKTVKKRRNKDRRKGEQRLTDETGEMSLTQSLFDKHLCSK